MKRAVALCGISLPLLLPQTVRACPAVIVPGGQRRWLCGGQPYSGHNDFGDQTSVFVLAHGKGKDEQRPVCDSAVAGRQHCPQRAGPALCAGCC